MFDLASVIPRGALDRVIEDVLSRRMLRRRALVAQLAAHGGPGRRKTNVLQELLDEHPERWERADGRFERRLLRFLKARGFPEPVLQHKVTLPSGKDVYIDAAYPERLVGLEANSYLWHTARADWVRNQVKTRALTAMGWGIIPVTWEEIERGIKTEDFTMRNVPERLRKVGDLWRPLLEERGRARLEQFL